jgi:hypothetical protein
MNPQQEEQHQGTPITPGHTPEPIYAAATDDPQIAHILSAPIDGDISPELVARVYATAVRGGDALQTATRLVARYNAMAGIAFPDRFMLGAKLTAEMWAQHVCQSFRKMETTGEPCPNCGRPDDPVPSTGEGPTLDQQIMNLPAPGTAVIASLRKAGVIDTDHPDDKIMLAYRVGHRDARHAAAELSLALAAQVARLTKEKAELRKACVDLMDNGCGGETSDEGAALWDAAVERAAKLTEAAALAASTENKQTESEK